MRKDEQYAIVPFRYRLNRRMEKMSTERLPSLLITKRNWYTIVPFLCEQPICPCQKLERRWNGMIAFPCELCHSHVSYLLICCMYLSAGKCKVRSIHCTNGDSSYNSITYVPMLIKAHTNESNKQKDCLVKPEKCINLSSTFSSIGFRME